MRMLYVFDEISMLSDDFIVRCAPCMPQERIDKINRLRPSSSKVISAATYLLLRFALATEYSISEPVVFEYGRNDKPLLKGYPEIHFNLSHTSNAVACALSDVPIGVDVQHVSKVSERVARRVLSSCEFSEYLSGDSPDDYFCRVWAIKESVLKRTGQGIAVNLGEMIADSFLDVTVYRGDGYYCAVTEVDSVIRKVSFEELGMFLLS